MQLPPKSPRKPRDMPGLIPTVLLRPYIQQWIEEFEATHGDELAPLWVLAFRAYRTTNNVEKIRKIYNGTIKHIEFDTADKIICAMGDHTVWYEMGEVYKVSKTATGKGGFEFRNVYWKTPLGRRWVEPAKRCARKGCNKLAKAKSATQNGGFAAKYCSDKCRSLHNQRLRQKSSGHVIRSQAERRYDKCPSGHDRNDQNTGVRKNGTLYCRACNAEANRARRKAQKNDS